MSTRLKIFIGEEGSENQSENVNLFEKSIENTTGAIQANINGEIMRVVRVDIDEWSFIIEVDCEETTANVIAHCKEVAIRTEEVTETPDDDETPGDGSDEEE